jgi:hypothetical protein
MSALFTPDQAGLLVFFAIAQIADSRHRTLISCSPFEQFVRFAEKFMPSRAGRLAVVLLMLGLICTCGRPTSDSGDHAASSADSQKLPFDRQPRSTGISPSQSLIPSATKLPEGTPIPIRLRSALSSASAHAGDSFSAIVDEPVVVDGQTLIDRGTTATGRVLEAKPATNSPGRALERSLKPGYLRIVLVSLTVGGRPIMVETSSIFAKGGSHEERNPPTGPTSGASRKDKDITFGVDRRLIFRLAQTVDLQ